MAINFVDEFQKNVHRGYNAATMEIFFKLKHTHFDDVLYPAKEVLNEDLGDNGCAMYVAPIALVCVKNSKLNLEDELRKAVAVTHTHEMAVNGALLQATAIHSLVKASNELNIDTFLEQMIDAMKQNGKETDESSFVQQLQHLKKLLTVTNPSEERVINVLGHSSQALYSVPTALYCFLRGVKYPSDVRIQQMCSYSNTIIFSRFSPHLQQAQNPFRQALEYAIILGGHTDTIASMTGALCGAYYGDTVISSNTLKECEGFDVITHIAQDLHNI